MLHILHYFFLCSDECASRPCENNGVCTDLINAFDCTCFPGFTGPTCALDVDECLGQPCKNGGRCNNLVNAFRCVCEPGWTGKILSDQWNFIRKITLLILCLNMLLFDLFWLKLMINVDILKQPQLLKKCHVTIFPLFRSNVNPFESLTGMSWNFYIFYRMLYDKCIEK